MNIQNYVGALLLALAVTSSNAATYYIDYFGGSDSHVGTSKLAPWKRAPGMKGFSGAYQHSSGDRFIFRGGVTWPIDCFQMKITKGGSSDSNRNHYGSDPTWYLGSTFKRPVFDFQHVQLAAGLSQAAGVLVENCNYITFDGLELANHRTPTGLQGLSLWGAFSLCLNNCIGFTFTNSVIRDWDMSTPIPYGASGGGGIIRVNNGHNNIVTHSLFHQKGVPVKSGSAMWNINQVAYSEIHDVATAIMSAQVVHDNHIHDLKDPTDKGAHSNVMLCLGGLTAYNNLIHDISSVAQVIFTGPGYYGFAAQDWIYNNVVYNVAQPCIAIDTNGENCPTAGSHVFNNTLVGAYGSGHCIRVGYRNNGTFPLLETRNNHYITRAAPILKDNPSGGGAYVVSFLDGPNLTQTIEQADADGYNLGNRFRPVDASKPTVNRGSDLSHHFTCDIEGATRGQHGSWDLGAYEFTGVTSGTTPDDTTGDPGNTYDDETSDGSTEEPSNDDDIVSEQPATPANPSPNLVNPGFENGLTGWQASGNLGVGSSTYKPTEGSNAIAFNWGQLPPNGVLSQSVATQPGRTYQLAFDLGILAFNSNEQRMQVTVQGAGVLLSRTISLRGSGNGACKWMEQSFTFVADSEAIALTFRDVSPTTLSLDMALDNVRLSVESSPTNPPQEPDPILDPQPPIQPEPLPSGPSLANGSFEDGYDFWTQSGNQRIVSSGSYPGADGTKLVSFNAGDSPPNGVLSQTFATTAGQKYVLSCNVGVLSHVYREQRLQLTVGGSGQLFSKTVSVKGAGGGSVRWSSQTFSFVANSSATCLTFQDVSPTTAAIDLLLDNVAVGPAN